MTGAEEHGLGVDLPEGWQKHWIAGSGALVLHLASETYDPKWGPEGLSTSLTIRRICDDDDLAIVAKKAMARYVVDGEADIVSSELSAGLKCHAFEWTDGASRAVTWVIESASGQKYEAHFSRKDDEVDGMFFPPKFLAQEGARLLARVRWV